MSYLSESEHDEFNDLMVIGGNLLGGRLTFDGTNLNITSRTHPVSLDTDDFAYPLLKRLLDLNRKFLGSV